FLQVANPLCRKRPQSFLPGEASPARRSGSRLLTSPSASFGVYPRRRSFRETARKKHGIEFGANQHNQRDDVHPEQQRNTHPERAVDNAVIDIMLQIPPKQRGGD